MKHDYELMYLPSIDSSSYVLVTSHGSSVAVRIYSESQDKPTRLDGSELPGLRELRKEARSSGRPIRGEEAHRTEDTGYWLRRIRVANRRHLESDPPAGVTSTDSQRKKDTDLPTRVAALRPGTASVFVGPTGRPLRTLSDWQALHPARHWKAGYSAMELARSWHSAQDFPQRISDALKRGPFGNLRLTRAIAECKNDVPGKGRPSQTDLMVEAVDSEGRPVVIGVEGKVDESFGPLVSDWLETVESDRSAENKLERLQGLCGVLELDADHPAVLGLRYQLLHRAYAALSHAQDRGASVAILMVHSFAAGPDPANRQAFAAFLSALGVEDASLTEAPVRIGKRMGIDFWAVWASSM